MTIFEEFQDKFAFLEGKIDTSNLMHSKLLDIHSNYISNIESEIDLKIKPNLS